jgi:hypothetical protein
MRSIRVRSGLSLASLALGVACGGNVSVDAVDGTGGASAGTGATSGNGAGAQPSSNGVGAGAAPTGAGSGATGATGGSSAVSVGSSADVAAVSAVSSTSGECEEASLACSDAASCPGGEVCCVELQGPMDVESSCAPECDGGFTSVQLCASDAECLNGEPCQEVFGGFMVCGSFGPGGPP